jgi:hypothetical protein
VPCRSGNAFARGSDCRLIYREQLAEWTTERRARSGAKKPPLRVPPPLRRLDRLDLPAGQSPLQCSLSGVLSQIVLAFRQLPERVCPIGRKCLYLPPFQGECILLAIFRQLNTFGEFVSLGGEFVMSASSGSVEAYRKHYSALADEDIVRLTTDVANLLPNAREALRNEMASRQLPVEGIEWDTDQIQPPPRVGGWLWLYCVGAVIVTPIWLITTLYRQPLSSIFILPYAVIVFTSGVLLWRGNPRGLVWVRRSFLYIMIFACLMLPFSFVTNGLLSFLEYVTGVAVSSIPVILWWFYFRRSKLVHSVYGRNMEGLRRQAIKREN